MTEPLPRDREWGDWDKKPAYDSARRVGEIAGAILVAMMAAYLAYVGIVVMWQALR